MPHNPNLLYEDAQNQAEQLSVMPELTERTSCLQYITARVGAIATRIGLATAIAISAGAVSGAALEMTDLSPSAAYAEGSTYPDADATDCSYRYGQYSWCKNGSDISSRGFGYRNRTDWAAFRAKQLTGILVPYGAAMGNAKDWDDHAPAYGFTVDNTPEAGDIAVWDAGAYGHVAIVESVGSNGKPIVSQYNRAGDGNYSTEARSADHYIDLNGSAPVSPGSGGGPAPNSGVQMIMDGTGQVWAKNSIEYGNWTQETPAGETAVAAGSDGVQMILDSSGQVWARNSVGYVANGGWTQETPPGIQKIAAGANGQQMILDSIGQVWAKSSIGYSQWTQETPSGEVAIAMGDNGLQMILDGSGQVWAKSNIGYGQWTMEAGGIIAIAAGDSGLQIILDNTGQVWAKNSVGAGQWTQETPPGITAVAAGNGGLQMIRDNTGQVWARNSVGYYPNGGWTRETPPGIVSITAGDNSQQLIIDSVGQVWAKNTIGDGNWTQETPPGELAIAAGS